MKTGYKVVDVMTTMPITVEKTTSLKDAAVLLKKYNINSLLVMEEKKLIGILIDEDFVRKVISEGKNPEKLTVNDIMEKHLITIGPQKDIYDAIVIMRDNSIRQLPVLENNKLAGFLTMKDILKIQPELFDLVAESIELREEDRKMKVLDEDI
jgi:CBS domain-containing protein